MANRPTLRDVAVEAGLSLATVDRVLNARAPVREETGRRVSEAAHRIGYHATALLDQRLRPELEALRVGVVLHKRRQSFYASLAAALDAAVRDAPDVRGSCTFDWTTSQLPADVAERLEALAGHVDIAVATAVDHPRITEAVQRLAEAGVPTVALLSDFAQGHRLACIGLDNRRVGRVAGWMIATAAPRPGPVAVFVGGHRWQGHELRETGFRTYLREHAPHVRVLDTLVNLETRELTREATLELLGHHPDLAGLYVAGGGMEGAIEALREERAPGDVALVVNELTDASRAALVERYVTLVCATPVGALCADVVALAREARYGGPAAINGRVFLDAVLHVPESV